MGRAAICSQHWSSRGRSTEGLCPGAGAASSHPGTCAASGPRPGTWKDPDPRRRSSRGSGAQNRPACAAVAATRCLRPVPSQRFLALWRQAHTPSCSRQVTSTRMVNQARLALLAVTHCEERAPCLWLEQFQIADFVSMGIEPGDGTCACRMPSYVVVGLRRRLCQLSRPGLKVMVQAGCATAEMGPRASRSLTKHSMSARGTLNRCSGCSGPAARFAGMAAGPPVAAVTGGPAVGAPRGGGSWRSGP